MTASELDPVIHAPSRLRIITTLNDLLEDGDSVAFPRLQELLSMTAGNLTTHLAKLESAGYVTIAKAFAGKRPVTSISITLEGRAAFRDYRRALLELLG